MRPNPLLTMAAILFAAASLPLLFAPAELLHLAGAAPSLLSEVLLQVLASALFGFAVLNWMSRYGRIDGIFGRPLVIANLAHTLSAALLLGRAATRSGDSLLLLGVTGVYAALAVAFGSRLFATGRRPQEGQNESAPNRPYEGA